MDFAMNAAGYGCKTYTVKTIDELKAAIIDSKKQTVSTLIDIKVMPKTMIHKYYSWWRVGVAEVSESERIQGVYKNLKENIDKARRY